MIVGLIFFNITRQTVIVDITITRSDVWLFPFIILFISFCSLLHWTLLCTSKATTLRTLFVRVSNVLYVVLGLIFYLFYARVRSLRHPNVDLALFCLNYFSLMFFVSFKTIQDFVDVHLRFIWYNYVWFLLFCPPRFVCSVAILLFLLLLFF